MKSILAELPHETVLNKGQSLKITSGLKSYSGTLLRVDIIMAAYKLVRKGRVWKKVQNS